MSTSFSKEIKPNLVGKFEVMLLKFLTVQVTPIRKENRQGGRELNNPGIKEDCRSGKTSISSSKEIKLILVGNVLEA